MTPEDITASAAAQSAGLWRDLKSVLNSTGFEMTDVVRTWFYNHRILDWYDDFNRERTNFFKENNIFGTIVPASTGIGASNARGAALSLDALAVKPKPGSPVRPVAVPSPLQCPANDYKSAFSRAVEISNDGGRHLFVSGTASIEPEGLTAYKDDLDEQIKLSLRVVEAILVSRGMDWNDVARAILYFPKIEWMPRFEPCRIAMNMPPLPAIFAHSDICRDDLLFEIELDAVKA
jgi:enamine deaminase RidA (YjgF/YER057c/UK114 family)